MSYQRFKRQLFREGGQCAHPDCTKTIELTVDHIIPKQFLETLGLEELSRTDDENFQVLCRYHNNCKGNKLDYTNRRTLPLLKKYVNLWITKHASYFIPIEKRVVKLGVVCKCCAPECGDVDEDNW